MKYLVLFLPLIIFNFTSCKKEEIENPDPIKKTDPRYDIHIVTLNLKDSADVLYYLDINGDGVVDCHYAPRTNVTGYDSSGYTVAGIDQSRRFWMADSSFRIAMFNDSLNKNIFEFNDEISVNTQWLRAFLIYRKQWFVHPSHTNIESFYHPFSGVNGQGYLAIQQSVDDKVYYGWISISVAEDEVIIHQTGFNNVANEPIRMGQED
jgi:hypothetical protein